MSHDKNSHQPRLTADRGAWPPDGARPARSMTFRD